MRGGIYKISIDGNDEADKHPRVVILGNQDSDQCLVIPCYSAGGEWAEAWIKELMGGGIPPSQTSPVAGKMPLGCPPRPRQALI